MILALLLTMAAAQPPPAEPPSDGEVIVTGRSLAALRTGWQSCIDRGCPPQVEIALAMEYGGAQLVAGDYAGGWRTVRTTQRRTLRHAERLPLDVAQISRATSRMANLNGEPRIARFNSVEVADALRAGLSSDDARILLAQLDIADGYLPERKYEFALAKYARTGTAGRKRGHPAIVAEAAYRRVALLVGLADGIWAYRARARSEIAAMLASTNPAFAPYRDLVRLTALNLLSRDEQNAAIDSILPTLKPRPANNLLLAIAPAIEFDKIVYNKSSLFKPQQWLDIRYRIAADGRVHDATVARTGPGLDPVLRDAALGSVGRRRYVPIALAADHPGLVNYVRYTFVFDIFNDTNSRIPRGASLPRVDSFDLGADLARRDTN